MASKDRAREFRRLVEERSIDEAFELLLRHSDRTRGYLRLRFGPFLGGRTGVEVTVVETILRAIQDPSDLDLDARGGLEFWLFRKGIAVAQDRIRADMNGGNGVWTDALPSEEQRIAREALEDAIQRLPEDERAVVELDVEHGGRAPMDVLVEKLGKKPEEIKRLRSSARARLLRYWKPEVEDDR